MWSQAIPTLLLFVGAPLVIWWVRRSRPGLGPALRVGSRTALTRNGVVAVIETDGRRFLIGATDHGINLLTELDRTRGDDTDVVVPMETVDIMDETAPTVPPAPSIQGPGKSPIETLRAMTVRKPTRSSFPHAHPRR